MVRSVLVAGLGSLLAGTVAAGPLTVDSQDPTWLLHDGEPIFFCGPGDPENFFHQGSQNPDGTRSGSQDVMIQNLTGSGANILWVTAVRSHGGDGNSTENPFVNNDPAQGVSQDVLDQWEGWISALDAAGIVTFFTFYDDGTRVWNTGSSVGQPEEDFFTELVNRFETYDHLIWNVCEEYVEAYNQDRVIALAEIIRAADDYDHPVAVHQHQGTQFHFADDPRFDVFPMHCGYDNTPASIQTKVLEAWNNNGGRYHMMMAESINHYGNRTDARRLSWAAAMAGGTVMVHKMDVDTPVEAFEDCGRLAAFFQATPFYDMAPRNDLARGETDYVFGDPSAGYLVYAADPSGDLGLSIPAGGAGFFDLRWMDCETGVTVEQNALTLGEGDHFWPVPSGVGAEAVVSVLPSAATSADRPTQPASWAVIKNRFR